MYIFLIYKEGCEEEYPSVKFSTLQETIKTLRRELKHPTNVSLYSPKREIFEDYNDRSFIIHDETTNTQETFSIDIYDLIEYSNGNFVNIDDFLRKYNYPLEIYNKDKKDFEEELKYQVTQLDEQQLANVTVYDIGYWSTSEYVCQTKRELITHLFDNIVEISNIELYPKTSEIFQIDFRDYKIKINYQGEEIIFTLQVAPSFSFFDSNFNKMSMEDFLTKFYIVETEKYTIEDFIKQKDDFIDILTNHLHELEKNYRGHDGVWGPEGHFDDLLQWHYQVCYGADK